MFFSNYVPVVKKGPAQGVTGFRWVYTGKHEQIILSETTRSRALLFDMKHHQVDLFQVYSNYALGAKNGPAPGVICST